VSAELVINGINTVVMKWNFNELKKSSMSTQKQTDHTLQGGVAPLDLHLSPQTPHPKKKKKQDTSQGSFFYQKKEKVVLELSKFHSPTPD